MSVARHHAEWLSLLETSGSFLSLPVLMRVFPQGLEAHDPALARSLRLAYDEWDENRAAKRPDPAIHREWLRYVIEEALGYPKEIILGSDALPAGMEAKIAEHHETIRPDLAIAAPAGHPDSGAPRLLIQVVSPGQGLERSLADVSWKVSPASRITELLKATGVRLGLLTNGEDWMLVHRGESFTYVTWSAPLWFEEPLTLRAFTSLLGTRRFFSVAEDDTLEAMLKESWQNQQEVTDQLGFQVRRAVEVLVQALDRCDKDLGRTLLASVSEKEVYEAALAVMMRLVFVFSAEERGLLLLGDPIYDRFYAVSTLGAQLREEADLHGQALLERRHDAWPRVVALFRAVYAGAVHDSLQIPAYGGALFDPDRFPFLEGRPSGSRWRDTAAAPLPINNRTVLHVIEALQFLRLKVPGGGPAEPRRLSFRGLGIEQIGHVYEGLLDHSCVRAADPVLGLIGARDKEEEIPLPELETYRSRGTDDLIEFLTSRTGRSSRALTKALGEYDAVETELFVCCDNDRTLVERVRPFAGILRRDDNDTPLVITQGSLYVTRTGDRRSTGTHYTPPSLTEPVVQYTLEPLVYEGPAEGRPRAEWHLRTPRELLALRVCDIAMGSGAFLVQACRYLAERLVEAWEGVERASTGRVLITPEGDLSSGDPGERLIPRDPDERLTIARRLVADRCLYGVDKNPQAVEMAKLSLWLVTSAKGRPFTFLDHALRCGDSLVGTDEETFLNWTQLGGKKAGTIYDHELHRALDVARAKRTELESFEVKDVRDAERKAQLLAEAERATARVKLGCDLIVGTKLLGLNARDEKARLLEAFVAFQKADPLTDYVVLEPYREATRTRAFHWPLEFSDVFADGGFSAFIGNPPFVGGQKITGTLGVPYRDYLVKGIGRGQRGSADLCAYFFLRAHDLLRPGGSFGLLATNTIAQGDTREVGLDQITAAGGAIYRAVPSMPWPGEASLEVAAVWTQKGSWAGEATLDGKPVSGITPFLTLPGVVEGKPFRLKANANKSFQGSIVLGMGFVLTPEEAQELIARNPKNKDVLFPYLNGEDLNSRPDQSPSRWVINFHDWPLNRNATPASGTWALADDKQRKLWLQEGVVPTDFPNPVAADHPDCLEIVELKVKPERSSNNDKGARKFWWRFLRPRPELHSAIAGLERYLVHPFTGKHNNFAFFNPGLVASHMTVVFALKGWDEYAILQSDLHWQWALAYGNKLETRPQYNSSDCFETFPMPQIPDVTPYSEKGGAVATSSLNDIGQSYYEHRQSIMFTRLEGLTATYNRFHNPRETAADIARLRDLHVEMDNAVATVYGWTDLPLDHGFHGTKQGLRFTLSDTARREVLSRLLAQNHARHVTEQVLAAESKDPSAVTSKGRRGSLKEAVDTPAQMDLL
jgi:hypothetical protein